MAKILLVFVVILEHILQLEETRRQADVFTDFSSLNNLFGSLKSPLHIDNL